MFPYTLFHLSYKMLEKSYQKHYSHENHQTQSKKDLFGQADELPNILHCIHTFECMFLIWISLQEFNTLVLTCRQLLERILKM